MSERNGDLPNGWVKGTIDELCALNPKHDNELSDETPVSFVPMAAVSDVLGTITEAQVRILGEVRKGYTHFADGDVIFAKITPCMENGKAASVRGMTNGLACGTTEFYVFRPRGAIDQDFLFHFIRQVSYRRAARATMQSGVGQARVPKEFVLKTELLVPPLAEQKRIVTKVEALQERSRRAREALSEVGPLLEQFRESVLAAAFRGDLTADWRAAHPNVEPASELLHRISTEHRGQWEQAELAKYEAKGQKPPQNWKEKYKEPEPVDESDLPELPEGWCWARFDEILCELRNGVSAKPNETPAGTPILRINSVRSRKVLLDELRYLPNADNYIKTYRLRNQDLLFTRYNGSLELVGVCGLVQGLGDRVVLYPDKLMRVRIGHQLVFPEFIEMYFTSPSARQRVTRKAKTTSGQQGVSGADIKAQPVPLVPLLEQQQLITRLQMLLTMSDGIEATLSKTDGELDHLDQAILAKAFRGELVPQDPSDEPASVLLERIRAQLKRQAKAPKRTLKSYETSKLGKNSSGLEPQQLTLAEVLRTTD